MANGPTTTSRVGTSYVEWGPIFARAVAAAALSFVLLTAGAAIGLSLVSPYPSQSYGKWAATLATGWVLVVTIGSFLVGGYIAGRMRLPGAREIQMRLNSETGFMVSCVVPQHLHSRVPCIHRWDHDDPGQRAGWKGIRLLF